MKKVSIVLLAITFIVLGCQTKYKYPKFDFTKNTGGNPCILAFKDRVFSCILEECYKGTDAMKEIHKRDVGNPYDGIYSASLFKSIDSIGKGFAKKIPPPTLCDECTKDQNYFMAQALHFYASFELDSVARVLTKFIINPTKSSSTKESHSKYMLPLTKILIVQRKYIQRRLLTAIILSSIKC